VLLLTLTGKQRWNLIDGFLGAMMGGFAVSV
jgi:hypothetical protein